MGEATFSMSWFFDTPEKRRKREEERLREEEADRKSFTAFEKPESESIIEYMEAIPLKDEWTENYLLFMRTLGKPMTAQVTHCRKAVPTFPHNIMLDVLEGGCECHELTLLCTIRNSNLRTFFGFMDGYHDGKYVQTVSHSFLLSQDHFSLFDMKMQYAMQDYDDMRRLKSIARNYFGAEIPLEIVQEIYEKREKGYYANHSNYLKQEIFTSSRKTTEFIQRIQQLPEQ